MISTWGVKWGDSPFKETPLSRTCSMFIPFALLSRLTARPWKIMVGIHYFPKLGRYKFSRGELVNFGECSWNRSQPSFEYQPLVCLPSKMIDGWSSFPNTFIGWINYITCQIELHLPKCWKIHTEKNFPFPLFHPKGLIGFSHFFLALESGGNANFYTFGCDPPLRQKVTSEAPKSFRVSPAAKSGRNI